MARAKKQQAMINKPKVLVLLGSTSAGKTSLGVKLAAHFQGEVVSADSRQVYQGMDIGTGKDLKEYQIGGKIIPHHLIDVANPKNKFDLAQYQVAALKAIKDILKRKNLPLIIGGSGLYLQALVDNYELGNATPDHEARAAWEKLPAADLFKKIQKLKPEFAARINYSDQHNPRRLARYLEIIKHGDLEKVGKKDSPYDFLILGLNLPDNVLKIRIKERLLSRLNEGLVEEVKKLQETGLAWPSLEAFGLEYKFVSQYLQGRFEYEAMVEKLNTAIYRFAKRQKTWFKRWEKQGAKIKWIKDLKGAEKEIKKWL